MYGGDYGYFLYEGWVGIVCLWLDLVGVDVFWFFGYEF